jgi:2-polyprenyl-3-methyl-5-hydroxy-6-metoxy-1,4-benzoquinol methylase
MQSKWLWDKLAGNWDKPGVSLGKNDIRILEKTNKYLDCGKRVLDYGCATGSISLGIADKVKEVQGIDISSRMIDIAVRKAGERNIKNAYFRESTIFAEKLEKESFDIILALNILHLLENSPLAMNSINKLLKPGGIFISATPCLGEKHIVSILMNTPVFLLSRLGVLPRVNFFSVGGLKRSITDSNFRIMETEYLAMRPLNEVLCIARKL